MSLPRYPKYKDSGVEWLGEVPGHWKTVQFRHLVEIENGSDHKHVEQDEGFPVYGSGGIFAYASDYLYDGESVLLGRKGTIDKPLHVTGPFWTVDTMYWTKIKPNTSGRYAYYAATTFPFDYYSTSTALPSMTKAALNGHRIALPPLPEQTAIAAFLDRETAKIDEMVAEQRRLMELLKEKRQAVISHAVTKGLHPEAPMKPSGIEWLGDVPEHWEVVTVRSMIREGVLSLQDGNHGESHPKATEFQSSGIPFLMAGNMDQGGVDLENCHFISEERAAGLRLSPALAGDVLLSHKGNQLGGVARMPDEINYPSVVLTPQITYYRIERPSIDRAFLYAVLQSNPFQDQLWFYASVQATRPYVGLTAQRELRFALPPTEEQTEIVDCLNGKIGGFDVLLGEAQRAIGLLNERRTALISAAVTGQIDVRKEVA